MHSTDGLLRLSASDLAGHLNCRHLTSLDLAVANGTQAKPFVWDPLLDILSERGSLHEQAYVKHLKDAGYTVTEIQPSADSAAIAKTVEAMKAGAQIITQAALASGQWVGRADVLRRVEAESIFGGWSYQVVDTKLARETKGGTVLQLCLYSSLLADTQKRQPEFAYVVPPGVDFEAEQYRLADYAAYYRLVRGSLQRAVSDSSYDPGYPDPKEHCDICRWRLHCDARRREDDHLSLVAGISKAQIVELATQNVSTMAGLAAVSIPLQWKPERGAVQSYEKVREQARIQVQGRSEGKVVYELLTVIPKFGLTCLPAPSQGDIFFDLEGDPFVDNGGLEYLFGYAFRDQTGAMHYVADWAVSRDEEKAAFEHFIDFVFDRLAQYPDLHIYHFAPYEPGALKRLMGRYASREEEVDRMLRSKLFVDLYGIVRHALRASVESYSIKRLEPLYAFARGVPLNEASKTLVKVQASLEFGDSAAISAEDRLVVQGYNKDDCLSTACLRDWLEDRRTESITCGTTIERPLPETGDPTENLSEWQKRVDAVVARLTPDIPADVSLRTPQQHARWLLAYLLDWHRREKKAVWWEHFRLRDLSADDLFDERAGLGGLVFKEAAGGTAKAPIHRYTFPAQETAFRGDEDLRQVGGEKFGSVAAIDLGARTIDIKKRQDSASLHPVAVYAHKFIDTPEQAESLLRIGTFVADNGIDVAGPYQAARDLLMRLGPKVGGGHALMNPGETAVEAATRLSVHLYDTILPIQGPPGAGKTFTGAHMICALAKAGKRIGVTANNHEVIRTVLKEAIEAGNKLGQPLQCIHKVTDKEPDLPGIRCSTSNSEVLQAIGTSHQVAGGTAWLWSREDAAEALDVLFVDEAAQMSLANVIAVSQAARSVVLLGDPRQLEQPMQGSHPDGTGVSALDHILGELATIPADRGLFLQETWRLHPDICAFTSELFYEGRLGSHAGLENQRIKSTGRINGTGLRFLAVAHHGNQNSSPEEANAVQDLVAEVLSSGTTWINKDGVEAAITLQEIVIIAPYNAQVFELQQRIPGARIGTVDKFQGQQAPIVIYSLTTSTHADAPRGMEFLYSLNRLNVATSRARCVCIIVGSPSVFEPDCRTPRQMHLANGLCRFLEMAVRI